MQKKTKVELGIIGVLVVLIVLSSLPFFFKKSSGRSSQVSVPATPPSVSAVAAPSVKLKHMKDDTFFVRFNSVADALPLRRDPFTFSSVGQEGPRDGLILTGILLDQGKRVAVVGGQFLGAGDVVGSAKIVSVQDTSVTMQDSQGTFELRLK